METSPPNTRSGKAATIVRPRSTKPDPRAASTKKSVKTKKIENTGSIKDFMMPSERNNNSALFTPDPVTQLPKTPTMEKLKTPVRKSSSKRKRSQRRDSDSDQKSGKKSRRESHGKKHGFKTNNKSSSSDSEKATKMGRIPKKEAFRKPELQALDTSWDPSEPATPSHKSPNKDSNDDPFSEKEDENSYPEEQVDNHPISSSEEDGEIKPKPTPEMIGDPISSEEEPEPKKDSSLFTLGSINNRKRFKRVLRKKPKNMKLTNSELSPAMIAALLKTGTIKGIMKGRKKLRSSNMASEVEKVKSEPLNKRRKLNPEPEQTSEDDEDKNELAMLGLLKLIKDKTSLDTEWNPVKLERFKFRHGTQSFSNLKAEIKDFVEDFNTDGTTNLPPMMRLKMKEVTPFKVKATTKPVTEPKQNEQRAENKENDEKDGGNFRNFEGIRWNESTNSYDDITLRTKVKSNFYGLITAKEGIDIKHWSATLARMEKSSEYWSFGVLGMAPGKHCFEIQHSNEKQFDNMKKWIEAGPHEGGISYVANLEVRVEINKSEQAKAVVKPKFMTVKVPEGEYRIKVCLPGLKDDDPDDETDLARQFFQDNNLSGSPKSAPQTYRDKNGLHYLTFNCGKEVLHQMHTAYRSYKRFNRHGSHRECFKLGRFNMVRANYDSYAANILLDGPEKK